MMWYSVFEDTATENTSCRESYTENLLVLVWEGGKRSTPYSETNSALNLDIIPLFLMHIFT